MISLVPLRTTHHQLSQKQRGSILVYALILSMLAASLGYVIFAKSEVLIENTSYQARNAKLSKNIQDKARSAINYDIFLNNDGGGFTDTVECPSSVNLWTPSGAFATTPYVIPADSYAWAQAILTCSWTPAIGSGSLKLEYQKPDYQTFSTGTYNNRTVAISPAMWGVFNSTTLQPFAVSSTLSGLDGNANSDNYTVYSTGTIAYPNGFLDNDASARKIIQWYVRRNTGWFNIFWNNKKSNSYIANNTNNSDPFAIRMNTVSSGYLYLWTNRPYTMKIVEFNQTTYDSIGELLPVGESITYSKTTGADGYIQTDGSTNSSTTNAKIFDFANKDYAIFLSSTGNTVVSTDAMYTNYKITGKSSTGTDLYIAPLDDSDPSYIKYLGNDIIIDEKNDYLSKQAEIVVPKAK